MILELCTEVAVMKIAEIALERRKGHEYYFAIDLDLHHELGAFDGQFAGRAVFVEPELSYKWSVVEIS